MEINKTTSKKSCPSHLFQHTVLTCVVRTGEEQSHNCDSISKTGRNFLPDFVKKFFFLFESYSSFSCQLGINIFLKIFKKIENPGSRIYTKLYYQEN